MKTLAFLSFTVYLLFFASQFSFADIDFTPQEKTERHVNFNHPTDMSQCAGGSEIRNTTTEKIILLFAGVIPIAQWFAAAKQANDIIREVKGWRCFEAECDCYSVLKNEVGDDGRLHVVSSTSEEPTVKCFLFPQTELWQDKRCSTPNCYRLAKTLRQRP
jgi:hypothetical protein